MMFSGGVYLPKSQSSRTITSFWWLFSIIVVATYSGNLIASLTVTRSLIPFNSVKEMVQQSTYKWGTSNGTYLNMLLQVIIEIPLPRGRYRRKLVSHDRHLEKHERQ